MKRHHPGLLATAVVPSFPNGGTRSAEGLTLGSAGWGGGWGGREVPPAGSTLTVTLGNVGSRGTTGQEV